VTQANTGQDRSLVHRETDRQIGANLLSAMSFELSLPDPDNLNMNSISDGLYHDQYSLAEGDESKQATGKMDTKRGTGGDSDDDLAGGPYDSKTLKLKRKLRKNTRLKAHSPISRRPGY